MFNKEKKNSTQTTMRYERDYRNYECYRPKISVDNNQPYSNDVDFDRNNNSSSNNSNNFNNSNNCNNYPNSRRVGNEYDNLAYGSSRDLYYAKIDEEREFRRQQSELNNNYNQNVENRGYVRNQDVNANRGANTNYSNGYDLGNNVNVRPSQSNNANIRPINVASEDKSRCVAQNQSVANTYSNIQGNRNNYANDRNINNRAYNNPEYAQYDNAPKKAKTREPMTGKMKALVIVYACIAILIVALVIVNCLPNANAQSPKTESQVQDMQFGENAQKVVIGSDGSTTNIALAPSGSEYKYDTDTNWFDKMCDWIENLVG